MSFQAFSSRELADIHFVYGFCNGNARAANREYRRRYPSRPVIDSRIFTTLHRELCENGIRFREREGYNLITTEIAEEVLRLIYREPTTSVRRIANTLGISKTSVWRILKMEGLYPFHFQRVQSLLEPDCQTRSAFCSWLLRQNRLNCNFYKLILWTDEASFNRSGINNGRNLHTWANANPLAVREASFQHQFSINVWAGMIGQHLIGPCILPHRLTGNAYLNFLREDFEELFDEVDLQTRRAMWFQHDGAPAHSSRTVKAFLDERFPDRWIGRGGPIAWPARSPDLTPLDYYLWGHMKQLVYTNTPSTLEELRNKVMAAADQIRENRTCLQKTTRSISYRATVCLSEAGSHFEQLI